MTPDDKAWWRSRIVLAAAPLLVLALVVGGGLLVRHHQDAGRLAVGDSRSGDYERAVYLPAGRPQVSVTVDGVPARPRVAGPDEVFGDSVRLADRAWLVDADRASTVRLRYRLRTKLERSQSDWVTAPSTRVVDVSTSTTYPAA